MKHCCTDNLVLDLRKLYGSDATEADKELRNTLVDIDENHGDGNFKIDTSAERKAVRDALENERPDLFGATDEL